MRIDVYLVYNMDAKTKKKRKVKNENFTCLIIWNLFNTEDFITHANTEDTHRKTGKKK